MKARGSVYYEKDLQGNVTGLIDASGNKICEYGYDAWGNVSTIKSSGFNTEAESLNHIGYRGYYRDEESNFYYIQGRYYDPQTCRFINADDGKYLGINISTYSYNLYAYCYGNPNKEDYSAINRSVQKSWDGQQGYGYGGINDCEKYLKDRYGGTLSKISSKSVLMPDFTMGYLEKNVGNCSLTAITRILKYYNNNGYNKIDNVIPDIYKKVKKVAKEYGYADKKGTFPTKINNIVNDVTDDYGYGKSKCNGIYIWTWKNEIVKEIDNNRPVIMNIAFGYYGNHTITVCGYKVYKTKHKTKKGVTYYVKHPMVEVYDGWTSSIQYLDFDDFASGIGIGSFNTVKMKK